MPATAIKHRILAANAVQVWQWFQQRGGIAVWKSVDMSNAGQSWTTPSGTPKATPCPGRTRGWRKRPD